MKFKNIFLSISIVGILGLSACSVPSYADLNSVYSTSAANIAHDNTELATKLQSKITAYYPSAKIKVDANHYNVLVIGQVKNELMKEQITALIKQQVGVEKVWNYTTINANPKLNENTELLTAATDRLKMEKNIYPQNVTIDAVDGNVYLMGTDIGNLTYFDKVERGINVMPGVNKVYNLIVEGPSDYRSEEDTGDSNNDD